MRKICIVSGTRAEYGLLYWLMKGIQADQELTLQIVVTGMHLSPEFGMTYRQIEEDGFVIDAKVEMLLSSDTSVGIAKSIGVGVMGFADAFERLKPDILVFLGDRFEILAAAQAAMVARIPIAHLHGGELTEGVIDESIRHSITKMSHLHFTSTDVYSKRVIQLGENPTRVFNFGAPGIESIKKLNLMTREDLKESLSFDFGDKFFLVTYHPVTLDKSGASEAFHNLLSALDQFPEYKIIMTYPNADTHGRIIIEMLEKYREKNGNRVYLSKSLGQLRYMSLINLCSAVIGNSSSGIIEAPGFHKPSVDIGNRQGGRLRPESVLHCDEDYSSILNAIRDALSGIFAEKCKKYKNPYGDGNVSERIIEVLKNVRLNDLIIKKFYDLDFQL